ncbi:MAG: TlpA family protein disulfide reductase [Odoribacter sp.]|nr:TlpA family protein disulfide reductase [Odoribacter sp.]
MKKNIVCLFALLLSIATFAQENEAFDWSSPLLNRQAPELKFDAWMTEKPDTAGKFIVLDFWATYCGPCVKFTPKMNKFARQFGNEAVFIAVATQDEKAVEKGLKQIQKAKKQMNEEYTPIEFFQATDPRFELFHAFQLEGIPSVIIIDPKGIVRWQGNPHGEKGDGDPKTALTAEKIKQILKKYGK